MDKVKYKIPNWNNLKSLGNSKAIKMTMFIPVLGYLILFNEHIISLISSAFEITKLSGENSISRNNYYFLYFGLTIVGTATFLFQLFCPSFIKEYQSIRDYTEKNIDYMTPNRLASLCKLLEKKDIQPHKLVIKAKQVLEKNPSVDEKLFRVSSIDILEHFWNKHSWSLTWPRFIIISMYMIGFLLLAIPSIKMFIKVMLLSLS